MKTAAFYSFKGGVGRSMAAFHVARECASRGFRVVLWDLDLEAPGLTMFPALTQSVEVREGTVELLLALRKPEAPSSVRSALLKFRYRDGRLQHVDPSADDVSFWFFPAGAVEGSSYGARLAEANLGGAIDQAGSGLERLRQLIEVEVKPDLLVIDSRTGISAEAIISTTELSDAVVILTALNDQSLSGTLPLMQRMTSHLDEGAVLLVASPMPIGEGDLFAERVAYVRQEAGRQPDAYLPYLPRLALSDEPLRREEAPFLFDAYARLTDLLLGRIGFAASQSLESIKSAILAGRYDEAQRLTTEAARQWPKNSEVQLLAAVACRGLCLLERARDHLLHGQALATSQGEPDTPFTTALSDLAPLLARLSNGQR